MFGIAAYARRLFIDWLLCQVVIGMDVAASEFYDNKDKTYDLNFKEEVIMLPVILFPSCCNLYVKLNERSDF